MTIAADDDDGVRLVFDPTGTVTSITIDASSVSGVTIDGGHAVGVFSVNIGGVTASFDRPDHQPRLCSALAAASTTRRHTLTLGEQPVSGCSVFAWRRHWQRRSPERHQQHHQRQFAGTRAADLQQRRYADARHTPRFTTIQRYAATSGGEERQYLRRQYPQPHRQHRQRQLRGTGIEPLHTGSGFYSTGTLTLTSDTLTEIHRRRRRRSRSRPAPRS